MNSNPEIFNKAVRQPLKLMYITNRPDIAKVAETNGVDRIWVDLETHGKAERQGRVNSVKSNHVISDVSVIRDVISKSELLVRINPLFDGSKAEIDEVIARGADIVMFPMFYTADDVKLFVDYVGGRAKVLLLVETCEAETNIDEIASVPGVDYIHIGLNDLHLVYGMSFMFELLANGQVETLAKKISAHGLPYGFGGIARLDGGMLPARHVIAEHYRLGSSAAILSRSFYDSWSEHDIEEIQNVFQDGMKEIRSYETQLMSKDEEYFRNNYELVQMEVAQISVAIAAKRDGQQRAKC
jgi:2-keto-3-deoxy-L-rhamnonate aldolase RhmA